MDLLVRPWPLTPPMFLSSPWVAPPFFQWFWPRDRESYFTWLFLIPHTPNHKAKPICSLFQIHPEWDHFSLPLPPLSWPIQLLAGRKNCHEQVQRGLHAAPYSLHCSDTGLLPGPFAPLTPLGLCLCYSCGLLPFSERAPLTTLFKTTRPPIHSFPTLSMLLCCFPMHLLSFDALFFYLYICLSVSPLSPNSHKTVCSRGPRYCLLCSSFYPQSLGYFLAWNRCSVQIWKNN